MDFVQFDALTGLYLSSPLLSNISSDTCTNPCQNPQVLSAVSISSHPWVHKPFLAMVYQCQQPNSPPPLRYTNTYLPEPFSVNSQLHLYPFFGTHTHPYYSPPVSTANPICTDSLVHIPILATFHQCQQSDSPPPFSYPSLLESTSDNNQPTSISLSRHTHPSFLGSTFVKSQPLLSSFSQYSYPSLLGSISDNNQPTSISLSRHTHPSFLGSTVVKSQPFSPVSLSIHTHLC